MDEDEIIVGLDEPAIGEELYHILDEMTGMDPRTEAYGVAADNLKKLLDANLAVREDERKDAELEIRLNEDERSEKERKSKRNARWAGILTGAGVSLLSTFGIVAFQSFLENQDILPSNFSKKALEETRRESSRWAQSQMDNDR